MADANLERISASLDGQEQLRELRALGALPIGNFGSDKMVQNFYEDELRKVLHAAMASGLIREVGESSPFFDELAKAYPALGSKIDWSRVPGAVGRNEEDNAQQIGQFISFFDAVVQNAKLVGDVVYVGDSGTDFAFAGSIESMREALPELLAIPQHHYLIGPACSWCMCFTMEGYMDFGFHPLHKRH